MEMPTQYRYTLESYTGMSSRYRCPQCNKNKCFSRYIDTETGEQLAEHVGRCNREVKCGYHYFPKQYFQDNGHELESENRPFKPIKRCASPKPELVSFIPIKVFKKSHSRYEHNHFVTYLISLFGEEVTRHLIGRYFIGTSKCWPGATVFYQIDSQGRIRRGKIMLYCPVTGKRIRKKPDPITSVHAVLKLPEPKPEACLFGEHLLIGNSNPVAIVESEKTAIIASQYSPGFTWLATGGLSNLNPARCSVLTGRKVFLFPDLGAYNTWSDKAKGLKGCASLTVVDLLEIHAIQADRDQGLDIADFFIRFNYEFLPNLEPEPVIAAPAAISAVVQRESSTVPEPVPKENSKQSSFNKLKEKYPAISTLAERLELKVVDCFYKKVLKIS